ncbi:MAG TPA: serine/threonine-protein kinase [Polyangiales bacterium]
MSSEPISSHSSHDALLRAVAHAPRAMDALAQVPLAQELRAKLGSEAHTNEPALGSIIDGRYRLESRLGAGGMGVVFAAVHTRTHKRVALKWMREEALVRSEQERQAARLRFAREARIAASIRHPNVVDVYDASREGEHPYLVMELLEGETLGARLRSAPLSWEALLAVLLPAMEGVAALHRQGVLHRDLKPDNVFVERFAGGLRPKVLDFGVASFDASASGDEASLTREGGVVGTPGYMPLEQLRGARDLDRRTDVYALGVIAYEALAGARPFRAGNAAEHAALLASSRPRDLGELLPSLRGPRARAVMKALARDPNERHPSVEAFAEALRKAAPPRLGYLRTGALLLVLSTLPAGHSRVEPPRSAVQEVARSIVTPRAVVTPPTVPLEPSVLPIASPEALEPIVPAPRVHRKRAPLRNEGAPQSAATLEREDFVRPTGHPADPATRLARDDFE